MTWKHLIKINELASRGKNPVASKICFKNKLLQTVTSFSYLGYSLSFTHETDIPNNITKFIKNLDTINSVIKPSLVQKHTKIKIYETLAGPCVAYG
jgi:hypothetical protein